MTLINDTAKHALNAAFNSVQDKTTFLNASGYNELYWDCVPQGENQLSEVLWDLNIPDLIKLEYLDTQGDFSNGPDVEE